jgi:hypothetical protein
VTGLELVRDYLAGEGLLGGDVYESPGGDLMTITPIGRNVAIFLFHEGKFPGRMESTRITIRIDRDEPTDIGTGDKRVLNLIRGIDLHRPDSLQEIARWVRKYSIGNEFARD